MAAVAGRKADIYVTSPPSVTFTAEATTADGGRLNYTITNAAKRYWDDTVAVTVEQSTDSGGTWATVATSAYTLRYVGGIITFGSARGAGTLVRVSGKYLPSARLAGGHDWTMDESMAMAEATEFGAVGKTFVATLHDASAKVSRFWGDSYFWSNLGARVVLSLYVNLSGGTRYEGFAFVKTDGVKAPTAGLIDESVDFQFDGTPYYVP